MGMSKTGFRATVLSQMPLFECKGQAIWFPRLQVQETVKSEEWSIATVSFLAVF